MNYYNEFDPKTAQWLQNLVDAGKIPKGFVDSRSITEVEPDELKRYTQCHFFAGIAGWSYALQLAGWPADRAVWTGSCPCQPFSTAGKQKGKADERHLWPVWFNLIRECRPPVIFGEQVAAAITYEWLDEVATDLESEDYSFGSSIIPACGVSAPHKRDRLWFVADGISAGLERYRKFGEQQIPKMWEGKKGHYWSNGVLLCCPDGKQRLVEPSIRLLAHGVPARVVRLRAYGNAIVPQVAAEFVKAYMEILK